MWLVLFIYEVFMKRALIITGGYINFERIDINSNKYDYIVAADSGYISAQKLGIIPDIIIGDFDSADFPETSIETIVLPAEKDDTDTMLACNLAIKQGCKHLTIVGGTGGRADHFLSNVFSLESFKDKGIDSVLTDGDNEITVLKNETVVIVNSNKYLSLFSVGECTVSLSGCKYPLTNHLLTGKNPSFAVSNEIIDHEAVITVKGMAILCQSVK